MAYRPGRHFLQIPGPTNVPDRVLRAIDQPTIDHRSREASDLALACIAIPTTRAALHIAARKPMCSLSMASVFARPLRY